ncbi:MAG: inner membrane protein [Bradymonadia bacterium]|jgi:inner membrane protein
MDSVTQALLGAAIGEAGWRRNLGGKAVLAGAILGTLPDMDVVAGLSGDWASLVHHRGVSHSLFFAPVLCLPLGAALHAWAKKGSRAQWIHLAFWVLITHPLLDSFTAYGTQLLAPFSNHRTAWDGIAIIDPVYTLPLVAALVLAGVSRAKPQVGMVAAWCALGFSTAYLGFGLGQSRQANRAATAALEDYGFEAEEVRTVPTLGNVFAWRMVARDADGRIALSVLSSRHANDDLRLQIIERPDSPLIDIALADERGEIARWFAMDMLSYRLESGDDGQQILWCDDQRYGLISDVDEVMWGARFVFDSASEIIDVTWETRHPSGDQLGAEFTALRLAIAGEPVSP